MFCLRLSQAATLLPMKRVARGTATYSFRLYGDADGPNYGILQHLIKEMQREEVSGANQFKMRAFATAIKAIHELDYPITEITHLKNIPGIGEGISRRIMEFIGANRKTDIRRLKPVDIKQQQKMRAMQELQRINGIGPIKARSLVEGGCMSLKQLHDEPFFKTLSRSIQASLQYQQDIGARITRQQAEAFMASMREFISAEFKLHLMGSYRRGHLTSSDIDVVLFHSSYTALPTFTPVGNANSSSSHRSSETHAYPPPTLLHDSVIYPLTQRGIIVSALSGGASRWQGLVKIHCGEEVIRRADIYLMPQPSEAAAFLAFTGDTHFNLDCRKRAKRRGMRLNEFGLWRPKLDDRMLEQPGVNEVDLDNINGQGSNPDTLQEYQTQWELVETPDEAALLQELDMGYIVPERRNLANLNTKEKVKRSESTQPRRSERDQPSPSHLARSHAPPDSNSPPRRHQLSQLQNPPSRPVSVHKNIFHGTHGHV